MNIHKLDRIFNPERIALIGVSTNPNSVSGTLLKNMIGAGFRGVVYPIHPSNEAVLGIPCFSDIKNLPRIPDLAIICSPSTEVPERVRECGEAGILGIIIISAGFRETGDTGRSLEKQILDIKKSFEGMRIIGPNCLGVIIPHLNLNASFAGVMPKTGHVAFISQSGALCTSVLDWALESHIGFSHFVSVGNAIDVDFADLIDYFGEDEKTKSIILYVESINEARKFMTASRAFARSKPIVAYKAGRFPESAEVASSHTGAMAAEDDVYDAAFQRAGIARVFDIGDIFDCADLIGRHKIPKGPNLAIVTNAGGPGVMATDTLIAADGHLASLSEDTIAKLHENLPPFWSKRNPVDVLGDARPKRVAKALEIVLADKGVDAVLVILTPQAMTNPTGTAKLVAAIASEAKKPILAAWLGGMSMREGIRILNQAGIAAYSTPEQAVGAFMTLVAYSRNLDILYETPRDIPVEFPIDRHVLRSKFFSMIPENSGVLSELTSKTILQAYGIPVTQPALTHSENEAADVAQSIGYPVVLKIQSPDISHKTDFGGVILDIHDPVTLKESYQRLISSIKTHCPDAKIDGVTIQPMYSSGQGIELILGAKKDPVFGSVLMAGLGGIAAEVYKDRAL
ncbi:acetate--CoA ligase family protein, partial [bacterium]|nr:acetate--CoA ligase family protein [candidate division CSSED10-310 bacterium]